MDDINVKNHLIAFVEQYKKGLEILENAVDELKIVTEEITHYGSFCDENEGGAKC